MTTTPDAHPALSRAAKAFRLFHAGIAVVDLVALGYIWRCGLTGRRGPLLAAAVAALGVEGAALIVGRGNCPLGPFQEKLGDPIPLFELVLPPRAAKAAVPVLTVVAVAGIAIALVRTDHVRTGAEPSSATL